MSTTEERLQRLEDEQSIRDLAARFADTATRNDVEGFRSLWTPDATWTIGAPYTASCEGIDEIVALLRGLWSNKDIFVQFVHSGMTELRGDRATARWIIHEVARGPDGVYYNTYGLFDDVMTRVDGTWRYTHRAYTYLFLDTSPFAGDTFKLPDLAMGTAQPQV